MYHCFLGQSPKTIEIITKIYKWDLIKHLSFCTAQETIFKKMKRQSTEWEKIVANDATDKSLISKIYKQPIQLNNNKTTQLKNVQKILIGLSPKKTY